MYERVEYLTELIGIRHFLFVEDIEVLVYILLVISTVVFFYGIYNYFKKWFHNQPKPKIDNLSRRIRVFIVNGILQRKVLYKGYEGLMHYLIFWGILLLFIATILRALEYDVTLRFLHKRFLIGTTYLLFKLMANIGGVMVLIGTIMAIVRRILGFTKELPNTVYDYSITLILIVIVITGFMLDALNTMTYRSGWIGYWDFGGLLFAKILFNNINPESIEGIYRPLWVFHLFLALISIATIPYTRFSHIVIGGFLNTFFSRLEHPSSFKPVENIEKVVETGEIGVYKLEDTTWKQRMDYDACVRCARCHNVCPAYESGKPLSPMLMVLDFKKLLDTQEWGAKITPDHIDPDVFWSCVTCGACVYECPMSIHHVETILDVRRALFAKGENTPEELVQVSYNIMRTGNSYGMNPGDREAWIRSLEEKGLVEIAKEGEKYDYIYWTGCNVSYDPNLRKVGESLLKILKKAGLKVGVLLEELCCGEPARRAGDELMFTEIAKTNNETLSKYRFNKILVNCPHGYNVFLHEYPKYGYKFQVEHHSQLISRLIDEGVIKPDKEYKETITYHDPCYLGRWNNVFEEPRKVLKTIKGLRLKEMPRNRERSFCCGAGGGHAFFELKKGKRISNIRMKEASETGAKTVAVACPFCNLMLRSETPNYDLQVKDIAEILSETIKD